ncbi:hypothetical protein K443DRAFT_670873 [Laccaria amethystina LaAM-08-1]|uniref:F-box domain-containing protein n=1 Tax=Laccaria amethystina LaAM-08-1 TaxID=1095629 RepID=A0A0C9XZ77_9AGAR|nr:hypothetical protein K443DRAFT_670873 [Laccaria amethystina LaAM-08-1]
MYHLRFPFGKSISNISARTQTVPPEEISIDELRRWIRSPGTLDEVDLFRIHQSIERHEAHLRSLAHGINQVQMERTSGGGCCGLLRKADHSTLLQEDRERIDASLQLRKSLLAPIRRLPPELLSEIFAHCLPNKRFVTPSPTSAPLFLGQVNALWRNISMSTPKLWSSMEISHELCKPDRLLPLMETWIARAKERPLSLSIKGGILSAETPQARWLASLFRQHTARWQHLRFELPKDVLPIFMSSLSLPMLETFEIYSSGGLTEAWMYDLSNVLCSALRLHHFAWDNDVWQIFPLRLPWSQLTRLMLNTAVSFDQCLTILGESHVLTHVSFQNVSVVGVSSHDPISLPGLISFVISIHEDADNDLAFFLDLLTLSNLREFLLNCHVWPHEAMASFLRRSQCPLESFNLFFPPVTETEIMECLEIVQATLEELTIQDGIEGVITDCILDHLTAAGDNHRILCPNLQVIALYDCILCTSGRYAKMIESRLNPRLHTPTMKVVEIYENEVELEKLKELRKQGLILKIYSISGQPLDLLPEEMARLNELREEGLVLRQAYGTFRGEADD